VKALSAHIYSMVAADGPDASGIARGGPDTAAIVQRLAGLVEEITGAVVDANMPLMEVSTVHIRQTYSRMIIKLPAFLLQAGLDSIGSVEFNRAIADTYSVPVPSTLIFDYPTLNSIAAYLAEQLTGRHPYDDSSSAWQPGALIDVKAPLPLASGPYETPIVEVSGVSCHFPGSEGSGLAAFWHTSAAGANLQKRIPLSKWDMDRAFDPDMSKASGGSAAMYCSFAAVLEQGVDAFDADAFRLTQNEAAVMDPHTRLLLEHVHGAVADGGRADRAAGVGTRTGVYVGCMWPSENVDLLTELGIASTVAAVSTGNTFPFMVGRVA
jgi:acyl carrier protein